MSTAIHFEERIRKIRNQLHPIVPFTPQTDKLLALDFTHQNSQLTQEIVEDTSLFTHYIQSQLSQSGSRYGIGGYNEHRTIYSRSQLFENITDEPRRLHLGIDIWGNAGTPVFTPLGGVVHSFAFNEAFGDYGATIILLHQTDTFLFHTLYGHLSLNDLGGLQEGKYISGGEVLAHFGKPAENGHWPPHLHFQVIIDMQLHKGDYPGVCRFSEREKYLANCPDPDSMVQMMRYAVPALSVQ